MLITDPQKLSDFAPGCRLWQGIPGVERTARGRLFVTFYSGGTREHFGNYCLLTCSDDDGKTWIDPVAVAYNGENARCFDPCLWIDPLGRLWFFWAVMPDHAVWAAVCDEPDSTPLRFHEPVCVGHDVMMNKPIVTRGGDWLLPIAVWDNLIRHISVSDAKDRRPFVYRSEDNGKTFRKLGGPMIPRRSRSYDEQMLVELSDDSLLMLVRTVYGIAETRSYDGGETWTEPVRSALEGPSSRFCIRRLHSGRLLLLNHYQFTGRNNLTAMLSEDEGKTWKGFLLLDERDRVSYPDMTQAENGDIYLVYDRGRGDALHSVAEACQRPREILMAKITESDILAGAIVSPDSYLKYIVNKLGAYNGKDPNPYHAQEQYSEKEYVALLSAIDDREALLERIFTDCGIRCANLRREEAVLLDESMETLMENDTVWNDAAARQLRIRAIVTTLRSVRDASDTWDTSALVSSMLRIINETLADAPSLEELADKLHINKFYLSHLFRKHTGLSVIQYRSAARIRKAKELLRETELSAAAIAAQTGFSSAAYFSRHFRQQTGCTPLEYRALHAKK